MKLTGEPGSPVNDVGNSIPPFSGKKVANLMVYRNRYFALLSE